MSEAKEKDRILAEIRNGKPHYEIDGLASHVDALKANGYVSIVGDCDGGIIVARITPEGERFLDGGGYTARCKAERKSKLSAKAWAAIIFALGIVLTELVHIFAEWLKQ